MSANQTKESLLLLELSLSSVGEQRTRFRGGSCFFRSGRGGRFGLGVFGRRLGRDLGFGGCRGSLAMRRGKSLLFLFLFICTHILHGSRGDRYIFVSKFFLDGDYAKCLVSLEINVETGL